MLRTSLKKWACIGISAILLLALTVFHPSGGNSLAHAGFFDKDLETLEEVVDLVSDKYVYPPNYRKLFEAAINQMLIRAGTEGFAVSDIEGGKKISRGSAQVQYTLNFDKAHNWEAYRKVYYFLLDGAWGDYNKHDLETAGVIGVMNSLDLYSQYLDKSAFDKSMRDTEGQYGGLGMVVTLKDKQLTIVKIMKKAPADRAGIMPGDVFLKVNGKSVEGMEIQELAEALRGYPKTSVSFSLKREGDFASKDYTLTREIISIETVEYQTMEDKIGYLKITSFSKQSDEQLKDALRQANHDGVKAFIIDLRDNPGGLLNQSVKIASHFLFRGRMVVYTQGRAKEDYREYRAQLKDSLPTVPVVVLINQHSASASEIVAGALRDSGRALIMGENSYGKGSVQTIFRISDGSGLRLTTSKYYTPSGDDISEKGIVPEIKIIKDKSYIHETGSRGNKSRAKPFLQLVEANLSEYLGQNTKDNKADDPSLEFARRVLINVTVANKNKTLEKARELAANIHY